ncbi:B-cell receptor CD22-like [Nerophis ophidion]|uniref:B-cell receptor CD22-like n=1 Tax=Nerophis ophidion TaxID=159077 RepID=UPI002ADF6455|nr:B-cell receptor CD22-like [Nerophis ophidion]
MSPKTGLVVLLLCMPGLLCAEWGGTYSETEICAIKGSTVRIQCSFQFPPRENEREIKVKDTFWFTKDPPEDLRLDPQYFGGVQSDCHGNICNLTIADVRRSDEYTFRFTTDHSLGGYTVSPAVKVTVTDLKVQVPYYKYNLKCVSTNCSTWSPSSYVWYKNGEEIPNAKSQVYRVVYDSKNSYSCAVRGHEQAVSPPECVGYRPCNKVVYHKRHICAIQGSSVDITCEYTSYGDTRTKFWFRKESSHRWNPSFTEDPQYEGRLDLPSETSGKSTLRIKDVRQSDSAEYRFKFTTNSEWSSISPGSTLTVAAVQVQVMSVRVEDSHLVAQMLCHTSCLPEAPLSFEWEKNGENIKSGPKVKVTLSPGDYITCAARQQHQHISISPHLYVLKRPSVSLSDARDILEGRPLTLTCYIDNYNYSSATDDYCWYKKKKNVSSDEEVLRKGRELVFKSINSSDSAEYWCTVENQLGKNPSEPVFIDVQYPPRWSSLSVSPSPVILEGQSVNLTCSSDAKPAASYTWFKDHQILTQNPQGLYSFTSIRPEDAGTFHCMSENKHGHVKSSTVVIDVQYAPRRPVISVTPSGEASQGSSVWLRCSSDANPQANYSWWRGRGEQVAVEELQGAKSATFNLSDLRLEDSGDYVCEASSSRGRNKSSVSIQVQACSWSVTVATAGGSVAGLVLVLLVLVLTAFLVWSKKRASKESRAKSSVGADCGEASTREQKEVVYSQVHFTTSSEGPVYANITPSMPRSRHVVEEMEDGVEYATVRKA